MQFPPPDTPHAEPFPSYRLHSVAGITWAIALGTPACGSILLALNYWKWGQKAFAAAAVVVGLAATAAIGWLAWAVPASVPSVVFLAPQVLGGYFLAKLLQGRRIDAHRAAGGRTTSDWVGVGLGLAFSALVIAAVAVWFFTTGINPRALIDSQESVDFGHGQTVFYSGGATRDDAKDFGEALVDAGYFDDTVPVEVLITGRAGDRQISFPGAEGMWDDVSNVDYMRDLAEYIAPSIGGKPLTVLLLDEDLYEEKLCRLSDEWRCTQVS
jgi:hypothetical protein